MIELISFFLAYTGMELVAWFTHKYVMHGFLWILHKDHHIPEHKGLERNDLFALIFALPSLVLIYLGVSGNFDFRFWIGIGIATYGVSYFLFHDVLFHKRLDLFSGKLNPYFRAVVRAHGDHHAGKKNFGFLFMFPWKYFREEFAGGTTNRK